MDLNYYRTRRVFEQTYIETEGSLIVVVEQVLGLDAATGTLSTKEYLQQPPD